VQEYEAIIRVISRSEYFLVDVRILQNITQVGSALVSLPNYIVAPPASSFTELVNKLNYGYSFLTSAQIASDQDLKRIDGEFQKLYSLSNVTLSYAANKSGNN